MEKVKEREDGSFGGLSPTCCTSSLMLPFPASVPALVNVTGVLSFENQRLCLDGGLWVAKEGGSR